LKKIKREYTVLFSSMTKEEFIKVLKKLDLSKAQLSREMGIAYPTVKSWYVNDKKMPLYAQKYIELLIELKKFRDMEKDIKSLQKAISKI
jgi:DNA-binding transcriptional regulator YiaG